KYKKVADRVKPVPTTLPAKFRIRRQFPPDVDPLAGLPMLPTHPPEFTPGERYTEERKGKMMVNEDGFLTDEEEKLVHYTIGALEKGFAWSEEEKGMFFDDILPPIEIPTMEHVPWVMNN
ncbi:hypothetical protein FA15DRAFT_546622, partial [Coprinopsis marcescibilis]